MPSVTTGVVKPMKLARMAFQLRLMMLLPLRLTYGLALIAVIFTPFGVYHSISEPYIIGSLWGYHLPVGYVGLASGIMVVLYPKIGFVRNLKFGSAMILIGLFLILSLIPPKEYFVNLLHGTTFDPGQVDVDYPAGNSVVLGLSILSIAIGSASRIRRNSSDTKPTELPRRSQKIASKTCIALG